MCPQNVDGDREFEFFVEFNGSGTVENYIHGFGELEAIVGADGEFGLGDITLDGVDFGEVGGTFFSNCVEELKKETSYATCYSAHSPHS